MKFALVLLGSLSLGSAVCGQEFQKQPARPADLANDKNLYVVGYAHLDTEWRWTYEHTIRHFIPDTMRDNIPLFEKYPNYVFNFTGSRRYEFMKEYYPAEYARVKDYVAKGRWFPAGSSVDEGDAIVPSLESIVRHALYGNRFFDREFGVHSDEFMLPDCFGFPAALPSILAHAGIKGFSTQKLTWKSAVGIPFSVGVWTGPDGASVTAAFNPGNYTGDIKADLSKSQGWLTRINATGDESGVFADFHYFGTGDRGGAPRESTVKMMEQSLASDGPVRVISDRADRMFNDITPAQAEKLPHYKGELLLIEHSTGSITSQAYMKRWNRKNELLASASERAASAAFWLGALPYPREKLYRGWDLLLGSQMHDILPGTSLPEAYEFSWNDEVLALNHFAGVAESSCAAVISALDTRVQGVPVAVYNPLSIEREDAVEATVPFTNETPDAIAVFDGVGKPVPAQIVSRETHALKIVFVARVPAVGYAVFDVRPAAPVIPVPPAPSASVEGLENARYRVRLDAAGDVVSVFDKAASKELLRAPVQLGIHTEIPAEKPAWHMDWSDRQKPARTIVGGPAMVRVLESGPARVALEVTRRAEGSTFVQQIRLAAGDAGNRLEFVNRIEWQTRKASLRAVFPLAVSNPFATYDSQVGTVYRANNNSRKFEHPQHQWLDLTGTAGDYGVAVLNDCKYGSDKPDDGTVRLTLLHTPGLRSRETRDQESQDIGRHEMVYAIAGHAGDWAKGNVSWEAARLNQPLIAFNTPVHDGPLGRVFSLLRLNTDQVEVAAIKIAEDNDELIVRVRELTGRPARGVRLTLGGQLSGAREVDGQEHPRGPAAMSEDAVVFDLAPYALKAFSLTLGRPAASLAPIKSQPIALACDVDAASTDANRADGDFDGKGGTYPAEQLPATLVREGVEFRLGATTDGAKNALAARGQTLSLPAGASRVYLLAASNSGDVPAELKIDGEPRAFTAQAWNGFIGQWDNRLWNGANPEIAYTWDLNLIGLDPGYIKRAPVAWFATHYHQPGGNTHYRFSYLFKHGFDLPAGATTLTLPNDERIRVFAVSASTEAGAGVEPAAPLYDTLAWHQRDTAPAIPQAGASFTDTTVVTLVPPLYYHDGDLRYTLDGREPTAVSAVYKAPFALNRSADVRVRQVLPGGTLGPVASGRIEINDTTPPRVIAAIARGESNAVTLTFSEPLDRASASRVANYRIEPVVAIADATLSADGREVVLATAAPLDARVASTLIVDGVADTVSPSNAVKALRSPVTVNGAVFSEPTGITLPADRSARTVNVLPLDGSDAWTLHVLVKPTGENAEALIAGFGSVPDRNPPTEGRGRYLGVGKNGICFWSQGDEVSSNSPLEADRWQMLAATYDGTTLKLYKDGRAIGSKRVTLTDDTGAVNLGVPRIGGDGARPFTGEVRAFTVRRGALDAETVGKLWDAAKPLAK